MALAPSLWSMKNGIEVFCHDQMVRWAESGQHRRVGFDSQSSTHLQFGANILFPQTNWGKNVQLVNVGKTIRVWISLSIRCASGLTTHNWILNRLVFTLEPLNHSNLNERSSTHRFCVAVNWSVFFLRRCPTKHSACGTGASSSGCTPSWHDSSWSPVPLPRIRGNAMQCSSLDES